MLVEVLGLLVVGSTLSWFSRKLGLSDVVGYILGGVVASTLMSWLGLDVAGGVIYGEPLSWLGLTLFFFTAGVSVGSRGLLEYIHRVLATELVLYTILWLYSGLAGRLIGAGHIERLVLFAILVNSSTVFLASLLKREGSIPQHIGERAIVQACVEDLAQFALFVQLLVAGGAVAAPGPIKVVSQILGIAALGLILFYASGRLLRYISRTEFVNDKENKLVLAVGSSMLFSYLASLLNLPPLFGAFVVGIAFSKHLPLDDVKDMLNGLKSLGLLLYFTSLGARLHLRLGEYEITELLGISVSLGLLIFLVRALGLFVVTMLVTGKVLESTYLALLLAPLSETGVVIADVLSREGVVPGRLVVIAIVITLTTLTLHGAVVPRLLVRAHDIASLIRKSLPSGVLELLRGLGEAYVERVNVTSLLFMPTIRFASIALAASYLSSLCVDVVKRFGLPTHLVVVAAAGSLVLVLVAYVKTLGDVVDRLLMRLQPQARKVGESVERVLDAVIGLSALVLQTNILYEAISKTVKDEPLYAAISAVVGAIILAATVLEFVRHLRAGSSEVAYPRGASKPRRPLEA